MFRSCAVLVFLVIIAVTVQIVHVSACHKEDGRIGRCMLLQKCSVSWKAYRTCGLRPDICPTGIQTPDICCPKNRIRIQERPIDFMCRSNTYRRPVVGGAITNQVHNRVIGGAITERVHYPHVAAIGYATWRRGEYSWECGGTLIHERYVLTAAHCVYSVDPKMVLLGALDVLHAESDPYAQAVEVEYGIAHEGYHPQRKYLDIGLVRLKYAIEQTPHVRPACLLTNQNVSFDQVTTLGWGVGSNDAAQAANERKILREARMTVTQCPIIKKSQKYNKYLICARGTTDAACSGDSGGPLQGYLHGTGKLYILGVYSHGSGRCTSETPSYFIRLTPFLDWIERKVWEVQHCLYVNKLYQ